MADRLKDKAALVLGAGSVGEGVGNGRAIAALFAREGARVAGADVRLTAA
jgi:NAD(P)-dependent dehydrogenase (short-subunit alcohol dehydrogenase family)